MNGNISTGDIVQGRWIARESPKGLSANEIMQILPHRYPFMLVDKIIDHEPGKWALGVKCVSINETYFEGHFPDNPIMPGVMVVEALAQVGVITLLTKSENLGKLVLFAGIKNALFKRQIRPGDTINLLYELVSQEDSFVTGKVIAKVDGKICVKAELLFALVDQ
ncbi:3-hydroxyacyl-[acyl-carrier-protein] dehydratase FabZ [Lachnospiraceae bacterium]|jgi:3-hydroxyacyl-[acyl-carrier-protein] dehydratase|nr:3-hydroxyacyl-[acyl-carrier-protein] dehydratase FabZ [Lachnospiraceae bacterium]